MAWMRLDAVAPSRGALRSGPVKAAIRSLAAGLCDDHSRSRLFLDLLWPLWDRRNQTLHDKAAGTVVLRH